MSETNSRSVVRASDNSSESHDSSYEDCEGVKGPRRVSEANMSGEDCADDEQLQHPRRRSSHSTDGLDDEGDLSDSVIIEYEREEGDGQECVSPKEKKLDDDEDRRNPQYIPKRGTFYEHDDRTVVGDEDPEVTQESEVDRAAKDGQTDKKKVWKEHESKWDHDKYNDDEQAPKSREELISIYGYDIRGEEGPPRARRRRRYGRGPNKYTRNWEDVEAYSKPVTVTRGTVRRGRGGKQRGGGSGQAPGSEEEFPPLAGAEPDVQENGGVVLQTVTYSNRVVSADKKGTAKQGGGEAFPPLALEQESSRIEERAASGVNENTSENVPTNAWMKGGGHGRKVEIAWQNANTTRGMESSKDTVLQNEKELGGWRKGGVPKSVDIPHVSTESSWRGGRGRAKHPDVAPLAAPPLRGRGRGLRGARGRSTVTEFITSPKVGKPGRSTSETRVPHHVDEDIDSVVNQVWVNSQVVVPTHGDLSKEMSGLLLAEQPQPNNRDYQRRSKNGQSFQQNGERRQAVVPPRLQDSTANRPKRYSSLRQRSAQEAAGITQPQQSPYAQPHGFYQQGYVQQAVYAEASPQQGAVGQSTATTPPVQMLPQAPAYAPPPPYPPGQQFIPARVIAAAAQAPYPGAPIINYVAPAPQGQFAPQPYPPFQHSYAAVAPGPPTELYQPQGGITYYSPEEQVMSRPITTQKRQRAAIPIVPPPEKTQFQQEAADVAGGGDVSTSSLHHLQYQDEKYQDAAEDSLQEEYCDGHAEQVVIAPAEQGAQA